MLNITRRVVNTNTIINVNKCVRNINNMNNEISLNTINNIALKYLNFVKKTIVPFGTLFSAIGIGVGMSLDLDRYNDNIKTINERYDKNLIQINRPICVGTLAISGGTFGIICSVMPIIPISLGSYIGYKALEYYEENVGNAN